MPAPEGWPETMATVLSCTYSARAGRALAFGLPASKHFRIRYNYWASDALHEDELYSKKPIPQGSVFPIRYDPDLPRNDHSASDAIPPMSSKPLLPKKLLLTLGSTGSLLLSLLWVLTLRGCS